MEVESLLEAFDAGYGRPIPEPSRLATRLQEAMRAARVVHPDVQLDDTAFACRLGEVAVEAAGDVLDALDAVAVEDLFLATAGAFGDPVAVRTLRARYTPDLRIALRAAGVGETEQDEVLQRVLALLFVREGAKPPTLANFSGRGSLRRWLRSVCLRVAARHAREHRREVPVEDAILDHAGAADFEAEHLRVAYDAHFKAVFHGALRALSVRQRNLLRQHYVDGLTIDELAPLYGVHRSTCARWIASARAQVLDATTNALMRRLGLAPSEAHSIIRLVRSRLDLSLGDELAAAPP